MEPNFYYIFPNMTAKQKFLLIHGTQDPETVVEVSVCIKFSAEYSDTMRIFPRFALQLISHYLISVNILNIFLFYS